MDEGVAAYIDAIEADRRPLFDRVHRLILELQPEAEVVLSYKMSTFVPAARRLHIVVWKQGLSFHGWQHGQDGGFDAPHPGLDSGKAPFDYRWVKRLASATTRCVLSRPMSSGSCDASVSVSLVDCEPLGSQL